MTGGQGVAGVFGLLGVPQEHLSDESAQVRRFVSVDRPRVYNH